MFKIFPKFIFTIFLLFQLTYTVAYSEIIKKLEVLGNERISKETIKIFGGIEFDKIVNDNDLNLIFKNLYKTGFFKNISVELEGSVLRIKVIENPIIETVSLTGVKNKKVKKDLIDNLILKDKSSYSKLFATKDSKQIIDFLNNLGYFFSDVEVELEKLENNFVNLTYKITLNDKAKLSKIKFIGDKVFKDRKLKSIIISEEYKMWKILSSKKFLNKDIVSIDKRLLRNFYKNQGYYNAIIASSYANLDSNNNNSFELIYNIDAGKKFFFNNLSLNISNEYDKDDFKDLDLFLKEIKGKKYSINTIKKIVNKIDKIFASNDLIFFKTIVNENIVEDKINLTFDVTQTKKYYVERIDILGNNVTQENVIRNNLETDEGDGFNDVLLKKSINNLKSLNFFETVSSGVEDGSSPEQKIITINVEEKPTGEITAGAGVGTNGATFGFSVVENNYLGRGLKFASDFALSEETIRGKFSVSNKNFNDTDRAIKISLESSETDRMTNYGYKSSRTGFEFGTGYEYYENLFFDTSISSYVEKIETSSKASTKMQKQKGNYFDTFLSYSLDYDTRNQKFETTDGYRSVFTQQLPIISDNNTLQNFYDYKIYKQYSENSILSVGFFAGMSKSITNEDVKLSERLFLPSRKLRGFENGKVGPRDSTEYIGGNYMSSINIASTLPKLLPNNQNFDFSVFLDAGNIWGVDYDSSISSSNKIRSTVGLSANWLTPIGPLSFSLSQNISKAETDQTETFRFNLGTTF